MIARIIVGLSFLIILGAPFLVRPPAEEVPEGAERLIVMSPHIETLRHEFGHAFSEWHLEEHGTPVVVDWRRPGGTSEIRKQLLSEYAAAIRTGKIAPDGSAAPGTMGYDLLYGGGTYEHAQMARGVTVVLGEGAEARTVTVPISTPIDVSQMQLDAWFAGRRTIGASPLYDEQRYWIGTALSSFGICFNRDVLEQLDVEEPQRWEDLTEPRLAGWLALADPRQSGSVATTYESILNYYGWDEGWRILRSMAANTHTFSASSAKVVIDVARGEAAMALAIDFYGRYESQALLAPGQDPSESRVGYVDPAGAVYVDPDPISLLRGAPSPDLAMRFIEFVMSEAGQALWQFPAKGEEAPVSEMGPRRFELRRMPIRPVMYERYFDRFIDQVRPYEFASDTEPRGWRGMIGPLFGAFAVDIHHEMRTAWAALNRARRGGASEELIAEMESRFFAMPMHTLPDGTSVRLSPEHYDVIRDDWRDDRRASELKLKYTQFFREQYAAVRRMAADAGY